MQKKISKWIMLAAFALIICLIWPLWGIFGRFTDRTNREKRELAGLPSIAEVGYTGLAGGFEDFFNDRLPFRNQLIELNTYTDYRLFHRSATEEVIVGKDDWLFYNKIDDGDPMKSFRGEDLYTEEELASIAGNLLAVRDELAASGREFVLYIAPNKERIYPELLPESEGECAKQYGVLQLVNYLRTNTDLRVVYAYNVLMTARSSVTENLYYKTDTHWNNVGAYLGSRLLLAELGIQLPALSELEIQSEPNLPEGLGDLADLMNLPLLKEKDCFYTLSGYGAENITFCETEFMGSFSYRAENADSRKLFLIRDSFCTAMADVLGSQFSASEMVHYKGYTRQLLEEAAPDIVVLEIVERNAGLLKDFTLNP